MTRPKKSPRPGTSREGAKGDQVRQPITPDDTNTKPSRLSRRPKRSWKRRKSATVDQGYMTALDRLLRRREGGGQ